VTETEPNFEYFEIGRVAQHRWDPDELILLLRQMSPQEAQDRGYFGESIDNGVFVCWHALSLSTGHERFILDVDLF